jgi:ubiquinone/menaquinone biosynthesis C-methylase UbiE
MNGHGSDIVRAAWERKYIARGRLYGRAPRDLPPLPAGSRVLEAGCGEGKTLAAMVLQGWEIVALDFSRSALDLSRDNPQLVAVDHVLADAAAIPCRDEIFDAVFLNHVTGHVPEPVRAIIAAESFRVLRLGGRLFFREFSAADFRAGTGIATGHSTRVNGDGILTHYFSRDEVIRLFSSLIPVSVSEERWHLKIQGKILPRAEIAGVFMRV